MNPYHRHGPFHPIMFTHDQPLATKDIHLAVAPEPRMLPSAETLKSCILCVAFRGGLLGVQDSRSGS